MGGTPLEEDHGNEISYPDSWTTGYIDLTTDLKTPYFVPNRPDILPDCPLL